jgi:hypothetical protein
MVGVDRRQRIQHERRPEADENQRERSHNRPHRREAEREQKKVAEVDLRQRVLERPVGHRRLVDRKRTPSSVSATARQAACRYIWPVLCPFAMRDAIE